MRTLFFCLVSFLTMNNHANIFSKIKEVDCNNPEKNEYLKINIKENKLLSLIDGTEFDNTKVIVDGQVPTDVYTDNNFYESGLKFLGSTVVHSRFGTVGLLKTDSNFNQDEDVTVFFMEAMTGDTIETLMKCKYLFK